MIHGIDYFSTVTDSTALHRPFLPEIAIIGRSNSGKSTLINALASKKRLAYTSKTPGCTRTLNFFRIADKGFFVDLPGYGFARAAREEKKIWSSFIEDYLLTRPCLRGVLLLVDSRRGLTALDEHFLQWFQQAARPVHIILSKADKLSRQQCVLAEKEVLLHLKKCWPEDRDCPTLQILSSLKKQGLNQLIRVIFCWLTRNSLS